MEATWNNNEVVLNKWAIKFWFHLLSRDRVGLCASVK